MNFDPQKLFIGLIDFFSILMPGALLTFIIKITDLSIFLPITMYLKNWQPEGVVVFLFISYLLGHFLFLIGSFLDDYIYDPIRCNTEEKQLKRLINGKQFSPALVRWLALKLFKKSPDKAVNRVEKIQEKYLKRINASGAINAFQWSKLRLINENPGALAIVNRFEANSKFFRSFITILTGLFLISSSILTALVIEFQLTFLPYDLISISVGSFVLLMLALWRYMEQRFKATQNAYWAILTIEAGNAIPLNETDNTTIQTPKNKPTHAGGVVYRQKKNKEVEYLLVRSSKNPEHWVLPKGHIEAGEDENFCALREVREETGVWARIVKEKDKSNPHIETDIILDVKTFTINKTKIRVKFYLMEYLRKGRSLEKREVKWFTKEDALKNATHPETRHVLTLANKTLLEQFNKGATGHDAEERYTPYTDVQGSGHGGTPA